MRERQRNGLRPIALDISGAQIEALVRAGVLDASMRDDAAEIALGVGRLVERLCELLSITPAVLTAHPELAIIFGGAAS